MPQDSWNILSHDPLLLMFVFLVCLFEYHHSLSYFLSHSSIYLERFVLDLHAFIATYLLWSRSSGSSGILSNHISFTETTLQQDINHV